MTPVRSATLFGLIVVPVLLIQGCSSKSGSLIGQDLGGQEERIAEPALKEIPPNDAHLTGSRTSPAMQSELTARNATGRDSGILPDILFDFDQEAIQGDALHVVESNAKQLQQDTITHLILEGRGDDIGTSAYNLVLGERRAKNVKAYLRRLGVTIDVSTTSYGKDRPLCFEHNSECRQKNRSVHLVVQ
ncbi:MAG: OmpA family protein [Nitrospira sp.]|nr:OmpA family protein [Nitrospira sp.]